jgi:hypothetical protein
MQYRDPFRFGELIDDLTSVEFLLNITFAGREYHFSSRPLVLNDEAGRPIQFMGGLSLNWTDALNLFNESPTLLSLPVALIFEDDIAELVSRGFNLWRAKGELSFWVEGRPYEKRIIILRGSVVEPTYGAKNEPVRFSLESNGFDDVNLTHSPTERLSTQTWPDPLENDLGLYYPIVYGRPGVYSNADGTPQTAPGSPVIVAKQSNPNPIGIIAKHDVEATEVTLMNMDRFASPVTAVTPVVMQTDLLGQKVATVDLGSGLSWLPGNLVWCIWDRDGGGLLNDTREGTMQGAGELLRYFLRLSSLEYDEGMFSAIEQYLNQNYTLASYVDEAVSPWEYIQDNFIPILPLSLYTNSEGVTAILWRREATKAEAVGAITVGGGVGRVGPVTYERQDLVNDIRLDFAPDSDIVKSQRSVSVIGYKEPDPTTEPDLFSNEYTRASFFRYGPASLQLTSDVIYDASTAINVLQWKSRALSLPYRVIEYDVPIRLGFLVRGDLVLLTDPEIHLFDYLCFVRDIKWSDGKPRLVLVLVDDPPRENRLG